MVKNAYIHIPFCKGKCNYCAFVSFCDFDLKDKYISALISQIKSEYKGETLETLYFGGGTPSLLPIDDFEKIISLFKFENNAEITVEVNPDSVDESYLLRLKSLGINRISIGSQTFDDEILKIIGRIHNSNQIKTAVKLAKEAGFKNISLDLIYGLPTQDLNGFERDLHEVIDLDAQHVSLYGLKIEEGCHFFNNPPQALSSDLDLQADMYLKAVEMLTNTGFEHYEISNFSKKSYNSKHNLNYWNNSTYYGFGCSASGYIDAVGQVCPTLDHNHGSRSGIPARQGKGVRYTNQNDLNKYIQNPLSKISEQELSKEEILEEAIFLGFRKIAGINVNDINQKFGIDFKNKYGRILCKYQEFFVKTDNGYALNLSGLLISNEILAEFIC